LLAAAEQLRGPVDEPAIGDLHWLALTEPSEDLEAHALVVPPPRLPLRRIDHRHTRPVRELLSHVSEPPLTDPIEGRHSQRDRISPGRAQPDGPDPQMLKQRPPLEPVPADITSGRDQP